MLQCYSKKAILPAKFFLDYVLSYFGIEKATYRNGPHRSGKVKAVVQFIIPYIEQLKFCGKLNIKARGDNSTIAEENAAYEALLLIEENFKVKIVDLNHSVRIEAANDQKNLVTILGGIIEVGEGVKDVWWKLIKEVEEQREHSNYEADSACKKLMLEDQIACYKYCADGVAKAEQYSADLYEESWDLFHTLETIKCKLRVIESRFGVM